MSAKVTRFLSTSQDREVKGGGQSPTVSLIPEFILGSTVSNSNTLCASVDTNAFVYCAGSTVILAVVNARLALDQRFFCARADALPSQATPSYYNPGTPTRAAAHRSYNSSLCRNELAQGDVSRASVEPCVGSPSKVNPAHRSRTLTTVALSPCGKLIAIGEVQQQHPTYRPC